MSDTTKPVARVYFHAFLGWQVEWLAPAPLGGQSNYLYAAPPQPLDAGDRQECAVASQAGEVAEAVPDTNEAAAFWASVYTPEGMTAEQVKAELSDYHFMMEQVPKVYQEVTGGLLSKTNYHAHAVIGVFNDMLNDLVDERVKEELEEARDRDSTAVKDRAVAISSEAKQLLEALEKGAERYRKLRDTGQCDSKHGSGLTIGDGKRAEAAFRFWCEPSELDDLIDSALSSTEGRGDAA